MGSRPLDTRILRSCRSSFPLLFAHRPIIRGDCYTTFGLISSRTYVRPALPPSPCAKNATTTAEASHEDEHEFPDLWRHDRCRGVSKSFGETEAFVRSEERRVGTEGRPRW